MRRFTAPFLGTLLSSLVITFVTSSWAASTIQVSQVVAQLRPQTQLPILLPNTVPSDFQIYSSVSGDNNYYEVSFDGTPDCQGATACNFGSISAKRGGRFLTRADMGPRDVLQPIRLANGMQGQFANTCGAYCLAQVQWQYQGVLYTVTIKNGTQADAVAMANSAIQGGVRAPSSSQSTEEFEGPFGGTVDRYWSVGAGLEDRGDFNSAQIQYQRALEAGKQLTNTQLRDCAVSGSQARIQSMEAARAYVRTHGRSPQSIRAAQQVAESAFHQAIDEIDRQRPELANSCP